MRRPAAQVDEVLLVSGGGAARKLDTIGCLERMSKARLTVPTGIRLGVAFNPFFPSKEARATEQKRLLRKLRTCLVDSVWLQLGSDAQLMDASLRWLRGPASVQTARWRLARVSGQRTSPPLPPSHTPATPLLTSSDEASPVDTTAETTASNKDMLKRRRKRFLKR